MRKIIFCLIGFCFVSVLFVNCCLYLRFEGEYDLKKSDDFQSGKFSGEVIEKIGDEIGMISRKYGFKSILKRYTYGFYDYYQFYKTKDSIPVEFEKIDGVKESLVLIFDAFAGKEATIYLRSDVNSYETEFTQKLRNEILQGVGKYIDVKGIKFKRSPNFL